MLYKRLFILVEGVYDKRFFESVIYPMACRRYDNVRTWTYASEKKEKIAGLIKSIKQMGADYIFIADINNSPCIAQKKNNLVASFKGLDLQMIQVVIKEIESWYYAGVNEKRKRELRLPKYSNTLTLSKELFNNIKPKGFTRLQLAIDILNNYDVNIAKKLNPSFKYFIDKYFP